MTQTKKGRSVKASPVPLSDERHERLVKVIGVGSSRYIAIGRIAPDVKVGDLLLAVFYPKSAKILLTPYEAVPVKVND